MIPYPAFDKIAIEIGPFGDFSLKIHWYGIMYLVAFAAAWWAALKGGQHRDASVPAHFVFATRRPVA